MPEDAPESELPEFVTVADAAKRLQIAVRTAQRYAAKLAHSDTTLSTNGAVRLVRLSAMTHQAGKAKQNRSQSAENGDATVVESDTPHDSQLAQGDTTAAWNAKSESQGDTSEGATAETVNAALVAQLKAENAHLRDDLSYMKAALAKEQETSRALVSELTRANERASVLIAATATGKINKEIALPMTTVQPIHDDECSNEEQSEVRESVPPGESGADQSITQGGKWWQIWKRNV